MMDHKLRQIYDPNKMFGGKDILLSGDFLQMKAFGTTICNSLYVTVTENDVNCRRLISEFDVFHIEEQVRSKCELHKRCLKKFRPLPKNYPTGAS